MLLPSALSCGGAIPESKLQRPSRPKLPSFERYAPQQRSQSPVLGLIASCRALHGILGERFSTPSPSLETTLHARPIGSPFGETPTPPPVCATQPRGVQKRRRSEYEEDDEDSSIGSSSCGSSQDYEFSTPKRRRIVPLELPPGLQACDFEALADSPLSFRHRATSAKNADVEMPTPEPTEHPENPHDTKSGWSENDDKILVETVLSKLNLSSREWNDCAQQLGKDKDSLGRRWRLLVGEGNVGLRRGVGKLGRPELDIGSW